MSIFTFYVTLDYLLVYGAIVVDNMTIIVVNSCF